MGQITEQFVDSSDGVRVAVYEEGNANGPTVVLVHGWPDSHVLWDGVVPLLATDSASCATTTVVSAKPRCLNRFLRTRWRVTPMTSPR